jgi:solute carrier family 50 (sugar transporter)
MSMRNVYMQMPNVLGLLFGLAQMVLFFVYRNRNPKKNGAVSEMQQAAVQADDEKERRSHANADVRTVVVDIMPPPPAMMVMMTAAHQTPAVEVV